jgi:hypothetical protein
MVLSELPNFLESWPDTRIFTKCMMGIYEFIHDGYLQLNDQVDNLLVPFEGVEVL